MFGQVRKTADETGGAATVGTSPNPRVTAVDFRGISTVTPDTQPKNSLIMAVEKKTSEKIELSKGTLWLIGAIISLVTLAIAVSPQLFGWIREDQSKAEQLKQLQSEQTEIRRDLDRMSQKLDDIQKTFQQIEVKKAYELGAADGNHSKEKK